MTFFPSGAGIQFEPKTVPPLLVDVLRTTPKNLIWLYDRRNGSMSLDTEFFSVIYTAAQITCDILGVPPPSGGRSEMLATPYHDDPGSRRTLAGICAIC